MAGSTETPGAGTYELGPGSGRIAAATVTVTVTVTAELDLSSLTVLARTGGAKPLTDRDRRDIQGSSRKILVATAAPCSPGQPCQKYVYISTKIEQAFGVSVAL